MKRSRKYFRSLASINANISSITKYNVFFAIDGTSTIMGRGRVGSAKQQRKIRVATK